jgi:hypothetical protein
MLRGGAASRSGTLDARTGTHCIDAPQRRGIERCPDDGPLPTFRGHDDLDTVRTGNRLAQSAADTQAALHNLFDSQRHPVSLK